MPATLPTIFLSYARGDDGEPFNPDTSFVARLHRDLTAAGFDVWFDRESMPSRGLTFHQEIRDAVAERDRLLLVVGPHAVTSDYVQQEWQFAYFEAEKVVTPILRLGDYPLAIKELALLHTEDFRDDAEYDLHFEAISTTDIVPEYRGTGRPETQPEMSARHNYNSIKRYTELRVTKAEIERHFQCGK